MVAATIELHVLSYAGGEVDAVQFVGLGHAPVSIGRSPGCHLSLDDAERLISRSHLAAWVDAQGRAWLRNASSTTPVFVDGAELAPGAQCGLRAGQSIVLGRYLLEARSAVAARAELAPSWCELDSAPHAAVAGPGPLPGIASIPEEFDVFAPPEPAASASGGTITSCGLSEFSGEAAALADVFDALPGFDARGPAPAPELMQIVGVTAGTTLQNPMQQLLGDGGGLLSALDGGPFAEASAPQRGDEIDGLFRMPVPAVGRQASEVAASAPASTLTSVHESALDPLMLELGPLDPAGQSVSGLLDLIGDSIASESVPCTGAVDAAQMPRRESAPACAAPAPPAVPVPGLASAQETAGPAADPMDPHLAPRPSGAVVQVATTAAAAAPIGARATASASVPETSPAMGSQAEASALAAAFARGCGLQPSQLGSLDDAAMETLGRLFQGLVSGALQLIHARSSTKHELRAHMTMIATSGNNPLKFAPDAQAAMLQLVGRGLPGFMPPVDAVRDAFADLSAHQVGLVAASRSAMYAMAGRLSPEHIQQRMGGPRGFSGLLPSGHKAQLWDAFVAAHSQLLGEAREEFDAAFQGAFVDAYEGEVRRVQSGGGA